MKTGKPVHVGCSAAFASGGVEEEVEAISVAVEAITMALDDENLVNGTH